MNSATLTDASDRPGRPPGPPPPRLSDDAGFRPWHFFLLASLMAATAAVMLSRDATPAHLVLISITIISAGLAAAGFHRMLAPLAAADVTAFEEPLSARGRAALEREKALVLRSIKELEFDRAMGKMSQEDFDEMTARLRVRAIALMKQLDEGGSGYRDLIEKELKARLQVRPLSPAKRTEASRGPQAATAGTTAACASCGTVNDPDARFCKSCGTKLEPA